MWLRLALLLLVAPVIAEAGITSTLTPTTNINPVTCINQVVTALSSKSVALCGPVTNAMLVNPGVSIKSVVNQTTLAVVNPGLRGVGTPVPFPLTPQFVPITGLSLLMGGTIQIGTAQDIGPLSSPTFKVVTAALIGNASTATALAATPPPCGVNLFMTGHDARGNPACSTVPTNALTTPTITVLPVTNQTVVTVTNPPLWLPLVSVPPLPLGAFALPLGGTLKVGTVQDIAPISSPTFVAPVFTTSATTPLVIGGTATTSTLTFRTTTGVGATGADIIFQTGNNGATETMRMQNNGFLGIGTNAPAYPFHLVKNYNGATLVNVINTTAGAAAQAAIGASRTATFTDEYISMGVTSPTYSAPFANTSYLHSSGKILKIGTEDVQDIQIFTNGMATTRAYMDSAGVFTLGATKPATGLAGSMFFTGVAFASLATPSNGTIVFCTDCDPPTLIDSTCTSAGTKTGSLAVRQNGAWKCIS